MRLCSAGVIPTRGWGSKIGHVPSGTAAGAVELPGREVRVFHFGRYDALPLPLSRVIRVAEDVAVEVKDIRGREELPADYEPRPMDILKRRDGQTFRVLGFTSDKLGVELEGVDVTMARADSAFGSMQRIAARVESGEGSLGRLLSDTTLAARLESSAAQLDSLLADVKANPRRYVRLSIF